MSSDLLDVPTLDLYPIPPGRGRWRLTLHSRTYVAPTVAPPTWDQTIISEMPHARSRRLEQAWDSPAKLTFTLDGKDPYAASVLELQQDVCAWRWNSHTGADVCMFRGIITQSEDQLTEQSHVVNFTAQDYLAVIGRRFFEDKVQVVWTATDQDRIANLIFFRAQSANYPPGSYIPVALALVNPDGTDRGISGVLRDRTYQGGSLLGQMLDELAKVQGGFDYDIISSDLARDTMNSLNAAGAVTPLGPGRDAIRIFYPQQGVTRTDLMLIYGGNVSGLTRTVNSASYANMARLLGNNGSSDPTAAQMTSVAYNSDAAGTTVGWWPDAQNAADVTIQATLDQQAQGMVLAPGAANGGTPGGSEGVLIPSYTLTMRPGRYTYGFPNMGDTVPLVVQSGRLNVNTNIRVLGINYAIGDDGQEDVELTVGTPSPSLAKLFKATQSDVNALARR